MSFLIKKIYGRFNGKLFPLVSYWGCYFAFSYFWIIQKKSTIILAPTAAIGDTLYVFSFIESMDEWTKENNKKVLLYVSDRYKDILETYKKPSTRITIVYLKHCGFKHLFLMMLAGCKYHPILNKLSLKKRIIIPILNVYSDYFARIHRQKPRGMRKQLSHLLGFPLHPISLHKLSPLPKLNIDLGEPEKKVCILNPYSFSMYSSLQLFEKIAIELKKLNFTVYSNILNGQKEIEGTIPLKCNLYELYSIAKKIPLIVSVRSGILDFLIPSQINMFIIYDKWKISYSQDEDFAIDDWPSQGKLYEVSTKTKTENEILQDFHSFLRSIQHS